MFKNLNFYIRSKIGNIGIRANLKRNFSLLKQEYNFKMSSNLKEFYFLQFFDNTPCKLLIEDNYYTTKQPLIFINGKLSLINLKNSKIIRSNKNLIKFLNSIITALLICTLITYYKLTIQLSGIIGISALVIYFLRYKLLKSFSRIVCELNLLEDGKFVEFVTFTNKFHANIKHLSKPSKLQISTLYIYTPNLLTAYNPLILLDGNNKGIYLIPAEEGVQYNKELINAIFHKSYILAKSKIGDNDQVIQESVLL